MKRILMGVVLFVLMGMAIPTWAQDAKDCGTDAIKNQMNELVANYLSSQAKATDANGALAAANELQASIAALTAACANGTAEATAEPSGSGMPIEGKWTLTWDSTKEQVCAADSYYSTTTKNRSFYLKVEDGKLVLEDIFIWPMLKFAKDSNGNYFYRRNLTIEDGTVLSFEYVTSQIQPDRIRGTSTSFFQAVNCSLASGFSMVLADKNVICMVGSENSANLRSGPGTTFDRFGKLDARKTVDVDGYATSKDGFKWWKLASGGWIRSDLVKEAGRCEKVPETKA